MRASSRPLTREHATPLSAPGWIAVSVRARHMLARRLGRDTARELAGARSLEPALARLAGSAYGRTVRADMELARAQRAVAETVLWHVRVLAGWAPPAGIEPVRALAACFELVNLEDRLAYLEGGPPPAPFELGRLAAVWRRVAGAQSTAELRRGLAGSAWGDPGADDPAAIRLALRLAWARRVLWAASEARAWAAGAVALLLARELLLAGRPAPVLAAQHPPAVGTAWVQAASLGALRASLPEEAAWALEGVEDPDELWRAEAGWWRRVETDAERLARAAHQRRPAVLAAVVLLGVDGWRTAAALEVAARGGAPEALEVFDAVA